MRIVFVITLLSLVCMAFALNKPSNYYGATGAIRGNQQQVADFAIWNITSQNWQHAISPLFPAGTLFGIAAVGDGLLAYGSFATFGTKTAAGLAWFDGKVWTVPEGLGLYTYGANGTRSQYDNPVSATGAAYAAAVDGNNVYLFGAFNQVGNVRGGVAGLVQLTWNGASSTGPSFTVGQVGGGYFEVTPTNPIIACTYCPRASQPITSTDTKRKLITFAQTSGVRVFVYQNNYPSGDLFIWKTGDAAWTTITAGNGAIGLSGAINDFDVDRTAGNIYAVGTFSFLNNPVSTSQYLYVAVSTNLGQSFQNVVPVTSAVLQNYGNVAAVQDQYGVVLQPALTGYGFTACVLNAGSLYVAGGYRVNARVTNVSAGGDPFANELQTRISVISLTAGTITPFSQRFGSTTALIGYPDYQSVALINKLQIINSDLYAYGGFTLYNQVSPITNNAANRFNTRYLYSMRGAIIFSGINAQNFAPAFGGFLSNTASPDVTPSFTSGLFNSVNGSNTLVYFAANSQTAMSSTWKLLSASGLFQYGGDVLNNANNRWNVILANNRTTSVLSPPTVTTVGGGISQYSSVSVVPPLPAGTDGSIRSLHITKSNNILIFGGVFDFIGPNLVPGIGFFNPDTGSSGTVGGGLFQDNSIGTYYSDAQIDARVGGTVVDIDEYNNYLYAAGVFNRNNTGANLANIARNAFTVGGGWESVDGGCDGAINDIIFQGSLLYVTGAFSFCGLNPEGFTSSGLYRGRLPTGGIAVIDVSQDPSVWSWRPLGLGLQTASGTGAGTGIAMALQGGNLYVGGSFSSAGGAVFTNGIAKWDGSKWRNVVAVCQDYCSRDLLQLANYYTTDPLPAPALRKPTSCFGLRTLGRNVYCLDNNLGLLAWWDGSVWRTAGTLGVRTPNLGTQNSLIMYNGTNNDYVLVPGSQGNQADANVANFLAYNAPNANYETGFGGFSVNPNAMASASSIIISHFVLLALLFFYLF